MKREDAIKILAVADKKLLRKITSRLSKPVTVEKLAELYAQQDIGVREYVGLKAIR